MTVLAAGSDNSAKLPRLLYLGDVPVECSYHGSALLYRLLQHYPVGRLQIIESGLHDSVGPRRLLGVPYSRLHLREMRWLNTRLNRWVSSWLTVRATSRAWGIRGSVSALSCEAILTVAHGYSWLTAAQFARESQVPLHLIVHDDWPRMAPVAECLRGWLDRRFCTVYRQAASCFCVSPFMLEDYCRRYGVQGKVLYPSRAEASVAFSEPPKRCSTNGLPQAYAFAGTINSSGYARLIRLLAVSVASKGGKVLLYGPINRSDAEHWGLDLPNIFCRGLLPSEQLLRSLRSEADVLFVPMSFDGRGQEENMRLSFPSKLADYTAVGLPILICGPEYSSAVRWARQNEPVAEVVTSEDVDEIRAAVQRLRNGAHRHLLATRALEAGTHFFGQEAAETILFAALRDRHQAGNQTDG